MEQFCSHDLSTILFETSAGETVSFGSFARNVLVKSQALEAFNQASDVIINGDCDLVNVEWLMTVNTIS